MLNFILTRGKKALQLLTKIVIEIVIISHTSPHVSSWRKGKEYKSAETATGPSS